MRPIIPVAVALLMTACAGTPPQPEPPPRAGGATPVPSQELADRGTASAAIANLASASGSLVSGRMQLAAVPAGVRITGEVGGLVRNGAHSLQVHERGDCSAADASSAGPYFDPQAGAEQVGVVGGNRDRIVADPEGVARVDLTVPRAVLGGGAANDIAGRALLVLGATPGAFSARVACGEIAIAQ